MQITLFNTSKAQAMRDKGIQSAIDHAGEDWAHRAYQMIDEYIKSTAYWGNAFMIEDVRKWAEANGLAAAPHQRAWGGIAKKAIKMHLIKKVAIAQVKNEKAHCANANVYVKF